jgi:sialate O-acetylesterase
MNIKSLMKFAVAGLGMVVFGSAWAELTVAPIFGDDMVLQRDAAVPVWGTADGSATVSLQFNDQSVETMAGDNGDWLVVLDPMQASSPSDMTIASGNESISFRGVQVGEVWFCSGQSNMGFPLSNANDSGPAIADAGNHNIRLFRMIAGNGPATSTWQVSDASTAADFSAVCYWMGVELSQGFGDVPIGLIQATHDGTAIEHWQHSSGGIGDDYDVMVRSVQPYAVKGVLWYQGESNGGDAAYAGKLTDMINEWRADWAQDALPFGIVQLAYRSGWNVARNAQLEVADSIGDAFLVVIRDLPGGALHPPEKKPVGIRSAIGARGMVYGENIAWSGPIRDPENSYVQGGTVVINWKHLGGGLFTDDGLPPGEFRLADSNGRFKSADAAVVGSTVQVWSSLVAAPVRVQYSYRSVGNLYNHAPIPTEGGSSLVTGLKASEFEFALNGRPANEPPVAQFTYATNGLTVSLDASSSYDPDGEVVGFSWNLGDGTPASDLIEVYHEYASAGDYAIVLTVTDDQGATGQTERTITVGSSGGEATTMHVSSLIAYVEGIGRGLKRGAADVVVRDELGVPVDGVAVTVRFSGTFNENVSGSTDVNGSVRLVTVGQAKGGVTVSACILDAVYGILEYIPNTTACGP